MRKPFEEWRKKVGQGMRRYHFRQAWVNYSFCGGKYSDFKIRCFEIVNAIRKDVGDEPYSKKKFDEAWQYRVLAHENYRVAFDEAVSVIFGWW